MGICQVRTPQVQGFQPVSIVSPQSSEASQIPAANYGLNNYNSNTPTPQSIQQAQLRQQRERSELLKDMQDAKRIFSQPKINTSFPSKAGKLGVTYYQQAYSQLNNMLTGKLPIDLKRAVFIVENAYKKNRLSYNEYEKHIQNITKFCRLRMEVEQINPDDNVAKNDLLFRLFSDTLSVTDPVSGKKTIHYPVHYDFDDPFGHEDWAKMFVTKLMATNYGQCHSMPLLYLIIAHEIGAKAYLATSPSHTYIKYRSGNEWKNVELTNGHMSTDAFIAGSGYIKAEALRNHLYMDTLSLKQTVVNMMEDLSKGYYIKYGFDDLVLKFINTALQYYPNSWYGMVQKSDYYTALFQYIIMQANDLGYKTLEQVLSIPEAKKVYVEMHAMYDEIDRIGYLEMPKEVYEEWLQSMDEQKRKQQLEQFQQWKKRNKTSIKTKRNDSPKT